MQAIILYGVEYFCYCENGKRPQIQLDYFDMNKLDFAEMFLGFEFIANWINLCENM